MNVRNCRKCGKVFNYVIGIPLCQRCREEQEEKFQEVREYVRSNPGVDISQVSEACDVEPNQIRQWIREDRLQFAEDSPIRIPCEKCGTMMRSGRFCDACTMEMTNGFRNVLNQGRPAPAPRQQNTGSRSDRDKMRYL